VGPHDQGPPLGLPASITGLANHRAGTLGKHVNRRTPANEKVEDVPDFDSKHKRRTSAALRASGVSTFNSNYSSKYHSLSGNKTRYCFGCKSIHAYVCVNKVLLRRTHGSAVIPCFLSDLREERTGPANKTEAPQKTDGYAATSSGPSQPRLMYSSVH